MTRAHSMGVVSDAADMNARIDALLADPIMEWDHSPDIAWFPGEPLWPHPMDRDTEFHEDGGPGDSDGFYGGGNCVRYMVDVIGAYDRYVGQDENGEAVYELDFGHDDTMDAAAYLVDCDDCQVGLGMQETHCWNCGKLIFLITKAARQAELYAQQVEQSKKYFANMWAALTPQLNSRPQDELIVYGSHPSRLRGIRNSLSVIDEAAAYFEWPSAVPEEYVTYSEVDVWMTQQLLFGDGSLIEPYGMPRLDPFDPSLYVRSTRIDFGDETNNLLGNLRSAINWTPPDRGAPIFWDRPMMRWAALRLQDVSTIPEVTPPEIPRLELRGIRPDLYRPGYERYFESENTHVPTQSGRHRHHGHAGGPRPRQR